MELHPAQTLKGVKYLLPPTCAFIYILEHSLYKFVQGLFLFTVQVLKRVMGFYRVEATEFLLGEARVGPPRTPQYLLLSDIRDSERMQCSMLCTVR